MDKQDIQAENRMRQAKGNEIVSLVCALLSGCAMVCLVVYWTVR
jgi:hypothetical protein